MLRRHLGNIDANLDRATLEPPSDWGASPSKPSRPSARSGGSTGRSVPAGVPSPPSTRATTTPARRPRRDHGHEIYDHVEANLHWEVFQFLGNLEPIVYTLSAA